MPTRLIAWFTPFVLLVMLAFACTDAEARRIGGGRSFGGKPSMSTPFTKPTPPAGSSLNRQATKPADAATAAAPSRGLFGGMGGMLGGLLAGGLIGSLLFGGGMGAGSGFLDIILLAGLAFLAYRFFSRRKAASSQEQAQPSPLHRAPMPAGAGAGAGVGAGTGTTGSPSRGGFDWDALSGSSPSASSGATAYTPTNTVEAPVLPAGFDEEEFLRGAKAAYTRLNAAWDKRDIADIAQFATPAFVKEIQQQAAEDNTPGKTEIMLINASLVEVNTVGNEQIAQVYFNVMLREDATQDAPIEVREVWHFTRPAQGEGSWKLDGIQQVEQ